MSIPHPSTEPATPANVTARDRALEDLAVLRTARRSLGLELIRLELVHQAEEQKRDELVEEMRHADLEACNAQDTMRDLGFAIASARGDVDESAAALETARANSETADIAFADLHAEVWS